MIADTSANDVQSGGLSADFHRPASWLYSLIAFMAEQLPLWRDRPDRPAGEGETLLTSQLCAHLNSASRKAPGWDVLQFRTEEPDEVRRARRIDLVPAPSGEVIWINGRRYSDFDPLLPIECKRLPTPSATGRDKREYLRTSTGSTGGVQRFKAGHHGADHEVGVMIGYIQNRDIPSWVARLDRWTRVFARVGISGWTIQDRLSLERHNEGARLAVLSSVHSRGQSLQAISLHHLWIEMS